MTINEYELFTTTKILAKITDALGNPITAPDTKRFLIKDPRGQETEYTDKIIDEGGGIFSIVVHLTKVGTWYFRFEATFAGILVSDESELFVNESEFYTQVILED